MGVNRLMCRVILAIIRQLDTLVDREENPSPMAKYLYRTCPKCKNYLGVVVPEPPEPVEEVPIDAHCAVCGFKLAWKVVLGKERYGSGHHTRLYET